MTISRMDIEKLREFVQETRDKILVDDVGQALRALTRIAQRLQDMLDMDDPSADSIIDKKTHHWKEFNRRPVFPIGTKTGRLTSDTSNFFEEPTLLSYDPMGEIGTRVSISEPILGGVFDHVSSCRAPDYQECTCPAEQPQVVENKEVMNITEPLIDSFGSPDGTTE